MSGTWKKIRVVAWVAVASSAALWVVLSMVSPEWQLADSRDGGAIAGGNAPKAVFELVDHNERRVTQRTFAGRPLAVFFGFTHCPDVCPTTLMDLATMLTEIKSATPQIQVLFVSVDTERDTPTVLKSYVSAFDPAFVGLTGTDDAVRRAANSFRVHYKRTEQAGSTIYSVDHTSTVFLVNRELRFVGTIDLHENRSISRAKLERLAAN